MAKSRTTKSARTASPDNSNDISRAERVLAYMVFTTIGLSVLCFLIVIIGTPLGWAPWPVITILPLVGLPIGFVLIVTLIITNAVRRSRSNATSGSRNKS